MKGILNKSVLVHIIDSRISKPKSMNIEKVALRFSAVLRD